MSANAANPPPGAERLDRVGARHPAADRRCSALLGAQSFWVTIALLIICVVMSYLQPASFATPENFYNITRNFSFIGIMALGMTAVIATGGIDLSVGLDHGPGRGRLRPHAGGGLSLVGRGRSSAWSRASSSASINGLIIAYVGLSPFVTTLGMLAIARSVRGGAVGQPHALQVRTGRTGVQDISAAASSNSGTDFRFPTRCCF